MAVTDDSAGDLDGLVNGAIQTSWYVNNDAFGYVPPVLSRACGGTDPAAAPAHRQNEGATVLENQRTS